MSSSNAKLLGIKVGLLGFLIALSGLPVRLWLSRDGGFLIGAAGIAIGFVGIGLHFAGSLFGTDKVE